MGQISRDAPARETREKPVRMKREPEHPKRKQACPSKGEKRPKELSRLERQHGMHLQEGLPSC